jgi:O-antigen/teichoic acid export membrane protein
MAQQRELHLMSKVMPIRASNESSSDGLSNDALWMTAGNAVYIGCQWGVLVATVKYGTAEMVGQLSLGFAICAPIFLFCQLRLRAASATDAGNEYEAPEYLALRLLGTSVAVLGVLLICLPGHFAMQTTLTILAVAAAKTIESGSDLFYGFLQNAERMRLIAISLILRGLLGFAGFLIVLSLTRSLLWALGAFCAGWGLVLVILDFRIAARLVRKVECQRMRLRWRWSVLGKLARLSLPLGISAMLMSLAVNMPRYFVQRSGGATELGLFSALAYLTIASGMIVNSLAEVTIPRFAKLFNTARLAEASRLLVLSIAVTVVIGIASITVAALLSRPLVALVYREQYATSGGLLAWLMVAAAVANIGSIFSYILLAARKFNLHLVCLIALAVSTALASQLLVPRWHTQGAAFASIFGFSVQTLIAAWCVRRFLRGLQPERPRATNLIVLRPARKAASSV